MSESAPWTREQKLTLLGVGATLLIAVIVYYQVEKNRNDDLQRERQQQWEQQLKDKAASDAKAEEEFRNRPNLQHVSNTERPGPDGFTRITFHNTSLTRNAVVTGINLRVSDQALLDKIARYHPRVPPLTGAVPDKHEVRLIHGSWEHGFTAYNFYVYPEVFAEPDKPITLITCIVDAKLPAMDIAGEFTVIVSSGDSDTPIQVTLRSRQR